MYATTTPNALSMVPGWTPAAEIIVHRPAHDDPFPRSWFEPWLARPTADDILQLLRDMDDEAREALWTLTPKWELCQ